MLPEIVRLPRSGQRALGLNELRIEVRVRLQCKEVGYSHAGRQHNLDLLPCLLEQAVQAGALPLQVIDPLVQLDAARTDDEREQGALVLNFDYLAGVDVGADVRVVENRASPCQHLRPAAVREARGAAVAQDDRGLGLDRRA